jgi:hypothetical protein
MIVSRDTERPLWVFLIVAFVCTVATLSAAFAQQPSQSQINAVKQSCRSDYMSVCASVPPGGRAALQCLQQHQASVSPACQGALTAMNGPASAPAAQPGAAPAPQGAPAPSIRQQAALMREACGADFRTYCRGVGLGGGRAMACLRENQSRLTPTCRDALAEARAGR